MSWVSSVAAMIAAVVPAIAALGEPVFVARAFFLLFLVALIAAGARAIARGRSRV